MSTGAIRNAPHFEFVPDVLGTVAGQGGALQPGGTALASLANGATSVLSKQLTVRGARAVYFILTGSEDPSAISTAAPGAYMRQGIARQTNLSNMAGTDTNFGSATNSKGVIYRVIAASGGANDSLVLPFEFLDITITNAGAGPITNVRLDALILWS